ncbi:hypothetical protein HIM_00815 [Hirsutella minnesotensis 3608]|nr:hypothetical protein HIM_00815 [Hirsutella minnesotensis 3608]
MPKIDRLYDGDLPGHFNAMIKRLIHKDHLDKNLHHMVTDARAAFESIDTKLPVDPFDIMRNLVYQLTHRILGIHDIASSPKLLQRTLSLYEELDKSSATEIIFPNLPTMSKWRKIWAGAKLHLTFKKIVDERQKTGRTETDALQVMIDQGDNDIAISSFVIGAIFAGLINTWYNAAWLPCFISSDPYWHSRLRAEVDAVVSKHRLTDEESAPKVLSRLSMDQWEREFPLIELGLRDSIRIVMTGASIRKNISGQDIKIGGTNESIPSNAFAVR